MAARREPRPISGVVHLKDASRRAFLEAGGRGAVPFLFGGAAFRAAVRSDSLDEFIEGQRRVLRIPGLAACIVKSGRVAWSKGYGWANIKKHLPMDPDRTVQNIGSVSKTVVATAVMQLWEKGKFQLDDDVNERLPFAVRNPSHPGTPITYRLLLTHRSAIADGPSYGSSYACGDPKIPLETWLKDYLTPGGRYHDPKANFHPWRPGEQHRYSNVGFGLLGDLVERVSGESLPRYTRKNIFEPLGMKRTGWFLSDVDIADHAIPYAPAAEGGPADEELEAYRKFGLLAGELEHAPTGGDHRPLCLYSFPNYPDGSLRTGVNQLARFLLAYVNDGALGGSRILASDTVRLMLTPQAATSPEQGLCWAAESRDGHRHWGHNGGDPGIRTTMSFRPSDGVGAVVFVNRSGVDLSKINRRLFQEADRL
jgi:CubicO group peptidase (beta-lactamase class C family)